MFKALSKLHTCDHCPIRCRGARKPKSLAARIHRWHATWWPGWKLYLAGPDVRRAKAVPGA